MPQIRSTESTMPVWSAANQQMHMRWRVRRYGIQCLRAHGRLRTFALLISGLRPPAKTGVARSDLQKIRWHLKFPDRDGPDDS